MIEFICLNLRYQEIITHQFRIFYQDESGNSLPVEMKKNQRTPLQGSGKPEPLKYKLSGYWSRRIDVKNRLIYKVEEEKIVIISCRRHYS